MKKGDKVKINAYKHNGALHSISEETVILDINKEYIVCANKEAKITEGDGRSYRTNETAILFFYKNNWFNIICQFKKYGIFYYCNIASPYILENNIIKYIDYDLDLRVFPDGEYKILDKNEYKYHKKIMNYSNDLDKVLKHELATLIEIKKQNLFPFNQKIVENYYKIYKNLKK